MQNRLKEILLALVNRKVDFVVAGGVAAVLHGVERATMDIDLAVDMNPDNLKWFFEVMSRFGLTPRVPVPPEILMDPKQVKKIVKEKNAVVFTFVDVNYPIWHVDIFLREEHAFETLYENSTLVALQDVSIRIVSIEKLLDLKQRISPARPKDEMDIAELKRLIAEEAGRD